MPGFDGTGPRGMGPMTGGGRGFCSPWGIGRKYGFGRRYGSGRGYGFGRRYGFGMGMPYGGTAYPGATPYDYAVAPMGTDPYAPQMSREQELDFLRSQAEAMKGQLKEIDARIQELEKD